ncbi:MAG: hypothetical protein ACK50J_06605 [Planctomyces sp.]
MLPTVSGVQSPWHDSDAFFYADPVISMLHRSRAAKTLDFMLLELAVNVVGVVQPEAFSAVDGWPDAPRRWSSARTPLYLRDLSIRC